MVTTTFIDFIKWFFGWDRDREKHCPHPLDTDEWERIKRERAPTWPVVDNREPHLSSDRDEDESLGPRVLPGPPNGRKTP